MKDLTPYPPEQSTSRIRRPTRLAASTPPQPRRGKARKPIKGLITAAAVATTLSGGALLAQHDAVRAAQAATLQATDTPTALVAVIPDTVTATSLLESTATPPLLATVPATATSVALTTAQDAATLQPTADQATSVPATTPALPATATAVPATATVAKPTATPVAKKAVARTKSSR